jgi:hypothetical protein
MVFLPELVTSKWDRSLRYCSWQMFTMQCEIMDDVGGFVWGFEAELIIFGGPRWGVGFEPRCDDEINIKRKSCPA